MGPSAKFKMAARGPQMAHGVLKGVQPLVIGYSVQLLLNRFFDLRTPSSPISYLVTDAHTDRQTDAHYDSKY